MTDLQKNGRRVGNKQQQGLGPRSINLALTLLSQVLDDAVRQGTVGRNVAKMVERVRSGKKEMRTWTEAEARAFLATVESDRLNPAWQLSLRGLRRGEVLGLCWTDIDFQNKTLTIRRGRIEVAGAGIVEDEPKTARSRRTLPLDEALIAALRARKTKQAPTAVGLISPLMRSVAPTDPSGIPTSFGDCSRLPGCQRSGCTTLGTPLSP